MKLPEVFSDPPVFAILNFLRDSVDDEPEVKKVMEKYLGTERPQRKKHLLDEYLIECEQDPAKTVCFTTNSNLVYKTVKLVEDHLGWHFTKSQNVNLFHL